VIGRNVEEIGLRDVVFSEPHVNGGKEDFSRSAFYHVGVEDAEETASDLLMVRGRSRRHNELALDELIRRPFGKLPVVLVGIGFLVRQVDFGRIHGGRRHGPGDVSGEGRRTG
jgi:hypothetical protein